MAKVDWANTVTDWENILDLTAPLALPQVGDHKTLADLKWALGPEQLARDVQLGIYAHLTAPEGDRVAVAHHYIASAGPMVSYLVRAVMDRGTIDGIWAEALETIREMERVRLGTLAQAIPNNGKQGRPFECKAFGGCKLIGPCEAADREVPTMATIDTLTQAGTVRTTSTGRTLSAVPPEAQGSAQGSAQVPGTLLLIDALPLPGLEAPVTVLFEDWVRPIEAEYAAKFGMPWQLAKFRDGTGPMELAIGRAELPQVMALCMRHPLADLARAALVPRFGGVIVGTR